MRGQVLVFHNEYRIAPVPMLMPSVDCGQDGWGADGPVARTIKGIVSAGATEVGGIARSGRPRRGNRGLGLRGNRLAYQR